MPDDESEEVQDLKTILTEIEHNQLFNQDEENHIVKRDTAEEDGDEEARGWKNGKKKKKDKKKNKKKRKDFKEAEAETSAEPFTNGLQFSAYSSNAARPVYKPASSPPPSKTDSMIMYGLDLEGNPQYIDENTVSLLLQNPQAKQVYL